MIGWTPLTPPLLYVKLMTIFYILPDWNETDFVVIPTLSKDPVAPLIWIVDAADDEFVDLDTPRTMHNWIDDSGFLLLPSVSHFA
ncbi:MAG: hypothetical protein M1818_008398 [Claussenomyces sp. TS43310]|nr:MAG: hypothetical protein M1818_008398 [Claussenomyces sp. TS43310]